MSGEEQSIQRIQSYCAMCVSRCGAIGVLKEGRFVALEPDPSHPTGKALCAKGRAAPELVLDQAWHQRDVREAGHEHGHELEQQDLELALAAHIAEAVDDVGEHVASELAATARRRQPARHELSAFLDQKSAGSS